MTSSSYRVPVRADSMASHSSAYSGTRSDESGALMPPPAIPSPVIGSPRIPERRPTPKMPVRGSSNSWDEVDSLAYQYALRVAVLNHRLSFPPVPIPAPSPAFSTPPLPPTPPIPDSPKRDNRKSSFSFLSKSPKVDPDVLKLPKEFLQEFWGILAAEDGDAGWKLAVSAFLNGIKKGTKTGSGQSLREIPVMLEAFTLVLPPQGPTCAAPHMHQTHLLKLLFHFLPRLSYFSPMSRNQSEKDKDLCFRLRAEVQSYMLDAEPVEQPSPLMNGSALGLKPTTSRPAPSPTLYPTSTRSSFSEVKRKPSPVWTGGEHGIGEMAELVGISFDIPNDMLHRDIDSIKSYGPLEDLYVMEIRQALSTMASQRSSSQQDRQQVLSAELASILRDFPELAHETRTEAGSFFTPPRKMEVYSRLTTRVAEATGHGLRTRDLVERCKTIWGVASRREREKEVENLVRAWSDSIGSPREQELGHAVSEGVRDLSYGMKPSDPLPAILEDLLTELLSLLTTSITSIFPTTSLPPPPPPRSLLPLLSSARDLWTAQSVTVNKLSDLGDELKAGSVGEYVMAVGTMMGGMGGAVVPGKLTATGKDQIVEGFEKVARWMETEVRNVKKIWGNGLGSKLNPAAIILSKQLPLFLAELQTLDKPRGHPGDIFELYEVTGKLMDLWDDLCHGNDVAFDLDQFFEPHVMAWLNDTKQNSVVEWVNRSVGMDSWTPEGSQHHSQSVVDLFEFIREAAQVILRGLPLKEQMRAVYLVDYSKTVSQAVSQYASTVHALFQADLTPPKVSTPTMEIGNRLNEKLGSKAGSWLAKGQQAVKSLERKKVDGFVIPAVACTKLTDMGAAKTCVTDLAFAMEAEDTSRIVQANQTARGSLKEAKKHTFNITILRGENLLAKAQNKGADGFVTISDRETGERYIKTRTVLGAEDPRWEQSLELTVSTIRRLELSAWDRQLVGKHDLIGSASFVLNPNNFGESATRDLLVPLLPRGMIYLRVSMDGGEKPDVEYQLSAATRALDRAEGDMIREIVDKIGEFLKSQLSASALNNLTKVLRDKKKPRSALTDAELEGSLGALFEYLNENFSVFSINLTPETRLRLLLALWRRTVDTLISLLVPPLSDKPSNMTLLNPQETAVVFKWLQMLKGYFNAEENGVEHGVPLAQLQSGGYKDIITLGQYLDLPTRQLMDKASAAVRAANRPGGRLPGSPTRQNSNGLEGQFGKMTIVGGEGQDERMAEVLLRILRTRSDCAEFLHQQIGQLTRVRIDRQAGILEGK